MNVLVLIWILVPEVLDTVLFNIGLAAMRGVQKLLLLPLDPADTGDSPKPPRIFVLCETE